MTPANTPPEKCPKCRALPYKDEPDHFCCGSELDDMGELDQSSLCRAREEIIALTEERDALDSALESTTRELFALREANRWIPVGERLPEEGERVLVWSRDNPGYKSVLTFLHGNSVDSLWRTENSVHITGKWIEKWRPLPWGPEGEGR